jgi:hypothetical protein
VTTDTTDDDLQRARAIVDRVKPIFAGQGGGAQGAALAELLALYLAGHPAPLRDEVLAMHVDCVRRLIPVVENELSNEG